MKKQVLQVTCFITMVLMVLSGSATASDKLRIALVVKSLGNGFFESARDGAVEASKELGYWEYVRVRLHTFDLTDRQYAAEYRHGKSFRFALCDQFLDPGRL